jgi:hypothetical protein
MKQSGTERNIEFDLLPNALESLHHAIDHLAPLGDQPAANDFKRAILDVSHVVELLLKERLQREHPALIWRSVEKYPSLDAQTVSVDEAIARLDSICRVKISEEDRAAINASRRLRNSIQHFRVSVTEKETKIIIGKMLAFILDFSERELGYSIRKDLRRDDRLRDLFEIYEFYQEYYKKVEAEMRRKDRFTDTCSQCELPSFDLMTGVCEVCGHVGDLDNAED